MSSSNVCWKIKCKCIPRRHTCGQSVLAKIMFALVRSALPPACYTWRMKTSSLTHASASSLHAAARASSIRMNMSSHTHHRANPSIYEVDHNLFGGALDTDEHEDVITPLTLHRLKSGPLSFLHLRLPVPFAPATAPVIFTRASSRSVCVCVCAYACLSASCSNPLLD